MFNPSYVAMFTRLTLAEKVRIAQHANSRGFVIVPIADEVAGLEPEPIRTIPASEISSEHFPHMDNETLMAFKRYYATAEKTSMYPPLGYTPELRTEEKNAAALFNFMATAADKWGSESIESYGYPIARL